jgi:2-dehydropantoate 2-reductase
MKICIYGAGAIGGYMGVMLKRGGLDVSLVARGAHLEAINARGLTLVTKTETITEQMPASRDPRDLGRQDVVIIALKAHQAWEAAEALAPLLGPETAVVTAQNGVPWWYFHGLGGAHADLRLRSVDPGDRQWNAIGPERVIGCTVYPATEIVEPGVVKHIYGDQFGLGEPNRKESERLTRFAAALTAGGLKPRLFADIRDDIWLKLWGNLCFNPISALTHATLDIIATEPGTRALARNMMLEAQAIGETLGAHFRVDVERRIDGAAGVGAHRTSMLQDLDKGRPLEIDALLTAVQEMGRLVGIQTPYIDAVLGLVQQMGRAKGVYPTFPQDACPAETGVSPQQTVPQETASTGRVAVDERQLAVS